MAASDERVILVIGTGSIGSRHLEILRGLQRVRPIAVPLRAERVAEWRARGFEACTVEESRSRAPRGVIVCTETSSHAEHAAFWLQRCDVLCEKPLAPTADDAQPMLDAAARSGHRLHVACVLRFDEGLGWIRERLPKLGALTAVDVECVSWLPSWRPARDYRESYSAKPGQGGVLLDLVHELDYCRWLFGECSSVAARLQNRGILGLPPEVEESASLWWESASGVPIEVRLSYVLRPTNRRLRVWGQSGMLEWDLVQRRARELGSDGAVAGEFAWSGPTEMYRAQLEAWLRALDGGDAGALATGADGAAALRICDGARASQRARRWMELS